MDANTPNPHPNWFWWQQNKTSCTAWRCNTNVWARLSCKSASLINRKNLGLGTQMLSENISCFSNQFKSKLIWDNTTSQNKFKIKHLVWKRICFALEFMEFIVHTSPYRAPGGIWWTGRLEGDIFGKWVFPLKKITQPHARVPAIPNKLMTKTKMLMIADITAPREWLNTVNALCSLERSLALMWGRRGWTMTSLLRPYQRGSKTLGGVKAQRGRNEQLPGKQRLGSSAEAPTAESICKDAAPRASRTKAGRDRRSWEGAGAALAPPGGRRRQHRAPAPAASWGQRPRPGSAGTDRETATWCTFTHSRAKGIMKTPQSP